MLSKKSILAPVSLALALLSITGLVAPAHAAVYSDYARRDEYYLFGAIHNYWELWLVVDTDKNTLWIKWHAEDWFWAPAPGGYIHIWDDDGKIYWFDAPPGYTIENDGELTFTYTKSYKWVYAEVQWSYWAIPLYLLIYTVTLRCAVYVGDGSSTSGRGGGGGGFCLMV
jgi:hypothetical protein